MAGRRGPQQWVRATALTPDGRTLATLSGRPTIYLWDPATGRQRRRLQGHEGYVWSMHLAHDGRTLWSTGRSTGSDRTIRVWDLATGREQRRLRGQLLALSPDDKLLALRDEKTVVLADAATGKPVRTLAGPSLEGYLYGAEFTADGRTLVLWSDQQVLVWDVAAGRDLRQIPVQETELVPGQRPGYAAVLSPDGRLIAIGSPNHFIALRELATGKLVRQIDDLPDRVSCLAFSPDGRTLAWGGQWQPVVHLLELATGRERHRLVGHKGWITSLTFSADGRRLVSGSEDATALVWDLRGRLDGDPR